jgi:hypothetical protein
MNKKIMMASIMILFIIMSSNVSSSSEINENVKNTSFRITTGFTSKPIMRIEYDENATQEPIIPINESREIPLKVYYQIVGLLSNWHEFLYKKKNIQVSLEIIERPDWCTTASLDNKTLNFNIKSDQTEPKDVTLTIAVDRNVPAYTVGTIKIRVTSALLKGLIFTKIAEGNFTFDVPFTVGYIPIIDVEQVFTYKEIPPLNVTTIPFKITNLGNGKTQVFIEVKNLSGQCEVDYPDSILLGSPTQGEKDSDTIYISIKPYKNFTMESLKVEFTPSYYARPDLKGYTIPIVLTLKNDGSLREGINFELIVVIIIIVTIVLILVVALFLRSKK